MLYQVPEQLYTKPPPSYKPAELRKLAVELKRQVPERVEAISRRLYDAHGILITPEADDETINLLPELIAKVGELRLLTQGEHEEILEGLKPEVREVLRYFTAGPKIDENTIAMVFDGGFLWGEVFRHRFPEAEWRMGGLPRSSINYGMPVLYAPNGYRGEFYPGGELSGIVSGILKNEPPEWSLTRRMRRRAVDLGFMRVQI